MKLKFLKFQSLFIVLSLIYFQNGELWMKAVLSTEEWSYSRSPYRFLSSVKPFDVEITTLPINYNPRDRSQTSFLFGFDGISREKVFGENISANGWSTTRNVQLTWHAPVCRSVVNWRRAWTNAVRAHEIDDWQRVPGHIIIAGCRSYVPPAHDEHHVVFGVLGTIYEWQSCGQDARGCRWWDTVVRVWWMGTLPSRQLLQALLQRCIGFVLHVLRALLTSADDSYRNHECHSLA